MNQREIKLLQDLCTPRRGERAFSIVDLIQKKTIPLDLAAFLASKVARGASWIVCSGPGGVGKTTTMRMIATLLNPTHGEAYVCGKSIYTDPAEIRRMVGFMPDFFGVYEDLNVREYLHFFAAAYRIPRQQRKTVVDDVLELTDLTHKIGDQVDSLSRGMKQRLALARVLLHDPDLLLLDEPASGLDPRARIEVRELLKALTRRSMSWLFFR